MEWWYQFIGKEFLSIDTDLHQFVEEESNDKVHVYKSVETGRKTTIYLDKVLYIKPCGEELYKRKY